MADAPSHTDVSVLYLPLMPETSKLGEAMVQAGKDATESFGQGTEKLGDKITESVTKSTDKVKEVSQKTGADAADAIADGVKANSKKIEEAAADAGEKAKGKLRDKIGDLGADLFSKVDAEALGKNLGAKIGGALKDPISHLRGMNDLLTQAEPVAKNFGVDIASWGIPDDLIGSFQSVLTDSDNLTGNIKEFASFIKSEAPGIAAALESALGPIAVAAAAAFAVYQGMQQILKSPSTLDTSPDQLGLGVPNPVSEQTPASQMALPGAPQPVAAATLPPGVDPSKYTASQGDINNPFAALGAPPPPAPPGVSTSPLVPFAPLDMPDGVPAPPPPKATAPSSFAGRVPAKAGGGASTVPLVQNPDGTWTSPNPAWAHLIQRESGGRPGVFNNYDSNAQAGDPSQGLFQFTRSTWARSGGLKYGADPSKATPQQQAEIAANLIRSNPSGSDWGAGMSGRENASALLSGVGPGGTTSTGWWGSRSSGGSSPSDPSSVLASSGGGGGSSRGSISAPIGNQHDPLYVTQVAADGSPTSDAQSASQQLGSGFLDGMMQSVGLDGSVFKTFGGASNPMDFGATKMGMGLLNWGMGLAQQKGGARGMPGMGSSVAAGLGESPTRGSGGYTPANQTNHIDNSFSVTQNGVQGTGVQPWAAAANSSTPYASQTSQPAFGN